MPDATLTQKDNGRSIELKVGGELVIDLPENPTTGYRWSVRGPLGDLVSLKSAEFSGGAGSRIGGGGIRQFRFVARAPGKTTINLKNMRTWESEGSAIDHFSLEVRIG